MFWGDPVSIVGSQRAAYSSQCREKASREPHYPLQSELHCCSTILSELSNRIYFGAKIKILK